MNMDDNKKTAPKRKLNYSRIFHIGLPIVIIIIILIGFIQLMRWNRGREFIIDENVNVDTETEDFVFFMHPSMLEGNEYDNQFDILILGNDTVAYDKGGTNIAEMIEEQTGATVYNCALEGSFMASETGSLEEVKDSPRDAFCFFWISDSIQTGKWDLQEKALETLPEDCDREHYAEVLELLKSIDYDQIDLLLIYYDGHDYLAHHPGHNPFNMFDISSMEGSFTGSYERYPINYPYMQHMFITPTFCYATKEDGTRQGCDIADMGFGNLPTCLTPLQVQTQNYSVSYLDNFYGININEQTADQYLLEDGITPNNTGREMIANRISEFINVRLGN